MLRGVCRGRGECWAKSRHSGLAKLSQDMRRMGRVRMCACFCVWLCMCAVESNQRIARCVSF